MFRGSTRGYLLPWGAERPHKPWRLHRNGAVQPVNGQRAQFPWSCFDALLGLGHKYLLLINQTALHLITHPVSPGHLLRARCCLGSWECCGEGGSEVFPLQASKVGGGQPETRVCQAVTAEVVRGRRERASPRRHYPAGSKSLGWMQAWCVCLCLCVCV